MKFLEKDLEDIIYKNFAKCEEKGLRLGCWLHSEHKHPNFRRHLLRQVNLGAYGTADLILIDILYKDIKTSKSEGDYHRNITITIVELKSEAIGTKSFGQVKRYQTAVGEIIDNYNLDNTQVEIITALIGSKINLEDDFCYIINNTDSDDCLFYTYEYGVDGIIFKRDYGYWQRTDGISENICTSHAENFLKCYKAPFKVNVELKPVKSF